MTATWLQEKCLNLWFWPMDLVRARKYSPHARHRLEAYVPYTWVQVDEARGYWLKDLANGQTIFEVV